MDLYRPNIVTGYMAYLDTKRRAHDIGPVGMERQRNNCASVDCCTTKMLTVVTGQKMWMAAKSIVNIFQIIIFSLAVDIMLLLFSQLCAMRMPMEMLRWANRAIVIGNARVDIHAYNDVRRC